MKFRVFGVPIRVEDGTWDVDVSNWAQRVTMAYLLRTALLAICTVEQLFNVSLPVQLTPNAEHIQRG